MLYPKNGPKPLEAEDGEKIHGPPTPHRIKLSSEQEETTTRSKQVIPEKKKKTTTGCALSPVQFSEEKKQKPVTRKRRKQNTTNTTTTTTIIKKVSADTNHKLTEYYTVRRSVRKCKTTVLEEKQRDLESKIISGCEDGLEVSRKKCKFFCIRYFEYVYVNIFVSSIFSCEIQNNFFFFNLVTWRQTLKSRYVFEIRD